MVKFCARNTKMNNKNRKKKLLFKQRFNMYKAIIIFYCHLSHYLFILWDTHREIERIQTALETAYTPTKCQ